MIYTATALPGMKGNKTVQTKTPIFSQQAFSAYICQSRQKKVYWVGQMQEIVIER